MVLLGELGTVREAACKQACSVAEKMRLSLAEPYCLTLPQPDGSTTQVVHHCTVSMGLVLYWQHAATADQLLQFADAAMYQAKALGRNRVQLYQAAVLRA